MLSSVCFFCVGLYKLTDQLQKAPLMCRTKDSFRLLRNNTIFHWRFHNILSLDPTANQTHTAHILTPYLQLILILSNLTYTVGQAVFSMQVFRLYFSKHFTSLCTSYMYSPYLPRLPRFINTVAHTQEYACNRLITKFYLSYVVDISKTWHIGILIATNLDVDYFKTTIACEMSTVWGVTPETLACVCCTNRPINQSFIYSPTDALVSCLKNNIKISIKTTPTCFDVTVIPSSGSALICVY